MAFDFLGFMSDVPDFGVTKTTDGSYAMEDAYGGTITIPAEQVTVSPVGSVASAPAPAPVETKEPAMTPEEFQVYEASVSGDPTFSPRQPKGGIDTGAPFIEGVDQFETPKGGPAGAPQSQVGKSVAQQEFANVYGGWEYVPSEGGARVPRPTAADIEAARDRRLDVSAPGLAGSMGVNIAGPAALQGIGAPGLAGSMAVAPSLIEQQRLQQLQALSPSQFAGQQADVLAALQAQAEGRGGPSPAELMLQAERDRILSSQMALAASQTGRELPAAQRQIMQQAALSQQQAGQQAAILRAQEQQQAQQALMAGIGQAQQAELARAGLSTDIARANQAQALQAAMANQAARQQAAQLTSQRQQFGSEQAMQARMANLAAQQQQQALQQAATIRGAELTAGRQQAQSEQEMQARLANQAAALEQQRMEAEHKKTQMQTHAQITSAQYAADTQARLAEKQAQSQMMGSVIGAVGALGAAALSDRNEKRDIKNISKKDLAEFFKAYKPQTYKYKNEAWGEGDRIGFMIQDIEKTKVYDKISRKVDIGNGKIAKGYDRDNLLGLVLAKMAFDEQDKKKGKK